MGLRFSPFCCDSCYLKVIFKFLILPPLFICALFCISNNAFFCDKIQEAAKEYIPQYRLKEGACLAVTVGLLTLAIGDMISFQFLKRCSVIVIAAGFTVILMADSLEPASLPQEAPVQEKVEENPLPPLDIDDSMDSVPVDPSD